MPIDTFSDRLRRRESVVGLWSSLPGVAAAALLASSHPDFVVTDLQHGAASEGDLPGLTAAIVACGVTPLVRVRSPSVADIGRALDLGAHGVFIPNVRGVAHVREVVSYCRYGPGGVRSYGRLVGGADNPLCILVLETAEAFRDLDAILQVEGVDGVYVGPKDLALSLGQSEPPGNNDVAGVVDGIVAGCVAAGMPVGVHASFGEETTRHRMAGASILTAAADTIVLASAIDAELAAARAGVGN